MERKYHKIPNVALEVCTAEQKIAYNLAFAYGDLYRKEYHRMPMQFQKAEVITAAARKMSELYRMGYDYKPGKFNEDMIHSALLPRWSRSQRRQARSGSAGFSAGCSR